MSVNFFKQLEKQAMLNPLVQLRISTDQEIGLPIQTSIFADGSERLELFVGGVASGDQSPIKRITEDS